MAPSPIRSPAMGNGIILQNVGGGAEVEAASAVATKRSPRHFAPCGAVTLGGGRPPGPRMRQSAPRGGRQHGERGTARPGRKEDCRRRKAARAAPGRGDHRRDTRGVPPVRGEVQGRGRGGGEGRVDDPRLDPQDGPPEHYQAHCRVEVAGDEGPGGPVDVEPGGSEQGEQRPDGRHGPYPGDEGAQRDGERDRGAASEGGQPQD
ncbi:hypothetical protein THAOC_18241, partial [Thalassiosira oceanica]